MPGANHESVASLRDYLFTWDAALLDRWIANLNLLVPGQAMDFKMGDAAMRADIVAYLMTLKAPK